MVFSYKSALDPYLKLGPIILTFCPDSMVPDKTLPKAKNLFLSVVGTILETYIIKGPLGSQFLMASDKTSSLGPS